MHTAMLPANPVGAYPGLPIGRALDERPEGRAHRIEYRGRRFERYAADQVDRSVRAIGLSRSHLSGLASLIFIVFGSVREFYQKSVLLPARADDHEDHSKPPQITMSIGSPPPDNG